MGKFMFVHKPMHIVRAAERIGGAQGKYKKWGLP